MGLIALINNDYVIVNVRVAETEARTTLNLTSVLWASAPPPQRTLDTGPFKVVHNLTSPSSRRAAIPFEELRVKFADSPNGLSAAAQL